MKVFNKGLIITPELFTVCKKYGGWRALELGAVNFDIPQ